MSVEGDLELVIHKLKVASLENPFQVILNYEGVAIPTMFHPYHSWLDCKQQFVDAVANFAEKLSPHDLKVFSYNQEVTDPASIFPGDELNLQPLYSDNVLPITAYTGTQETHGIFVLEDLRKETLGLKKSAANQRTIHSSAARKPAHSAQLGPWTQHSAITISSIDLYLDELNFEVNVLKSMRHKFAKGTVIAGKLNSVFIDPHYAGVSCLSIPLDVPLHQNRKQIVVWTKEYYCKGTPICKPNLLATNARTKNCTWHLRFGQF